MLTPEQIAVLDEVFASGDVHTSLLLCVPSLPTGDTAADRAERMRYWHALRVEASAKEYLAFLREDALVNGGVTLGQNTSDLSNDVVRIQEDLERVRRGIGQVPGAASAIASLHSAVIKARELQAKASGLYSRRETPAPGEDPEDGARAKGVKIEWV